MGCPQCRNDEINPEGVCLVCGFRAAKPAQTTKEGGSAQGLIEIDYSHDSQSTAEKDDLPQWRHDLAQRLIAIKQKREMAGETQEQLPTPAESGPPPAPQIQPPAADARPSEKAPARKQPSRVPRPQDKAPVKIPGPRIFNPQQKTIESLGPEVFAEKPSVSIGNAHDIQKLIDSAVSRQSVAQATPPSAPASAAAEPEIPEYREGKLLLLSRTLSGLIDLIVIASCTIAIIIAADFFSGIVTLDSVSLINYSLLFLMIYFLYSIFFLAASSQTVGMMITDLRVIGADQCRPRFLQLVRRCLGYLLSLLGLGFGLAWSLFDNDSLCLHDRLSRTHVVRI
jgi:uncharacterized RDD family membrane protein YckC